MTDTDLADARYILQHPEMVVSGKRWRELLAAAMADADTWRNTAANWEARNADHAKSRPVSNEYYHNVPKNWK